MGDENGFRPMGQVIQIDIILARRFAGLSRGAPNALLGAEADQLWRDVHLTVPGARPFFQTAIIERYRRRECSVEEAVRSTGIRRAFRFNLSKCCRGKSLHLS
jgi:hypothetical protein